MSLSGMNWLRPDVAAGRSLKLFFFGHFSVRDRNVFEMTEKIKSFRSECLKI